MCVATGHLLEKTGRGPGNLAASVEVGDQAMPKPVSFLTTAGEASFSGLAPRRV